MAESDDLQKVQQFIYDDAVQSTLNDINNHLLPINVLEISGMGQQEIKHSNVLAWLFGDNEHQLDHTILEKYLAKVAAIDGINNKGDNLKNLRHYAHFPKNNRDITIKREHNHIDILIEDRANNVVIVIENKVWAEESANQLSDYEKKIEEQYKDWQRFYILLSPDGRGAESDNLVEGWLKADYQMIYEVLQSTLDKPNLDIADEARMVLESYNDLLIKMNIVENKDLKDLCAKIWRQPEYKKALKILIQNEPNGVPEFLKKLRQKLVEEQIEIVDLNKTNEKYFYVIPKNYKKYFDCKKSQESIERNKMSLVFYVNRTSILFGLINGFDKSENLPKEINEINEKLNNLNYFTKPIKSIQSIKFNYIYANNIVKNIYDFGQYNLTDESKAKELLDKMIEIMDTVDQCFPTATD